MTLTARQKSANKVRTIARVVNSGFDQVIAQRFLTEDSAHRWLNDQAKHHRVVVLEGRWRTGHQFSIAEYTALTKRTISG